MVVINRAKVPVQKIKTYSDEKIVLNKRSIVYEREPMKLEIKRVPEDISFEDVVSRFREMYSGFMEYVKVCGIEKIDYKESEFSLYNYPRMFKGNVKIKFYQWLGYEERVEAIKDGNTIIVNVRDFEVTPEKLKEILERYGL